MLVHEDFLTTKQRRNRLEIQIRGVSQYVSVAFDFCDDKFIVVRICVTMNISMKERFVKTLLKSEVLSFGDFVTKSGRNSPYFFNTGRFDSAQKLGAVADIYAQAIQHFFGNHIDNLFGPAYKGIPLCVLVSDRLASLYRRDVSFSFNRKEAKDHGEGGTLVGYEYIGDESIVIVEDVLTGGTSLRETMEFMKRYPVNICGALVGIDRQERGLGSLSAREEIEQRYSIPVRSIVNLKDIIDLLYNREVLDKVWIDSECKKKIDTFLKQYGSDS
ncbi:MAG: orotate phosphoribosyltransferase [Bdellovibrionota bacterium]